MRGRQTACAFTGYRPPKLPWQYDESDARFLDWKRRLRIAVEQACDQGMEHFLCGMAQGCDLVFGETVVELRDEGRSITLEAAVPCPSQAQNWPAEDAARWLRLLAACDYETVVQDHYSASCMMRRNRYMVDHASLLIAAYDGQDGGTRRTVEYALRRRVPIVLVSPEKIE